MNSKRFTSLAMAAFALFAASFFSQPVQAAVITDAANDFLPTYVGPQNGDLDVLNAEVSRSGSTFQFTSTSNGTIGFTPGGFFVWGVNRGLGTARFGALASGVLFDSVVILTPGGTSTVRDLIANVSFNLNPNAITISGSTITAQVDAALLPSQGFQLENYTVNLWPRLPGGTNMIADFAPDNSNASVTATPEPATITMLGASLVVLGAVLRRRGTR